MDRKIICTNEDNVQIIFGQDSFNPFVLTNCEGIYTVTNNVYTQQNTMVDGTIYTGSTVAMRNILLTVVDKENHAINRNLLYTLFKPKSPGIFEYIEGDIEHRKIEYYVESIEIESQRSARYAVISLLCPDPFFRDMEDITILMAGWNKVWEFQHEFLDEKEEFGVMVKEQVKEIQNDTGSDQLGLTITIVAEGTVVNPIINHLEEEQYIKVGTSALPFNMQALDKLVIITESNNKNVRLIRGNHEENVNYYLDEGSDYIQLVPGTNMLRYGADTGEENMLVTISYRNRYLGV